MIMRYLYLAILATTVLSQSAPAESADVNMARQLDGGDFTWDIQPEDGFPIIGFDDATEEAEVMFKYNFTGTLTDRKFLDVNLYQSDCVSPSDTSLAFISSTSGDELDVDVAIIQETISKSVHYQDVNITAAIVGFCVRVDYSYIDNDGNSQSVNFHQENVTINVDLTANFTFTGIDVDRPFALIEAVDAELDYPVKVYLCSDDNSEVVSPAALSQGSILRLCFKIDDIVATENVLVEDVFTLVVSQPDGTATDYEPITNGVADPLTDKVCRESGICNIKTQLLSKFFTDEIPGALRVDGDAILGFGKASLMPSSAPTVAVRRLRAPIRGLLSGDDVKAFIASQQQQNDDKEIAIISVFADSSQRTLQNIGAQSEFGLEVSLNLDSSEPQSLGITIQPEDDFPIIAANDNTNVVLKYNFTGGLSSRQFLEVNLYQNDCISPSDKSLLLTKVIVGDELGIDIDVIQETILNSVHYHNINATAAIIGFCVRVDYNFIDNRGNIEIVTFYLTNASIDVDLTDDNFILTNIEVLTGTSAKYEADNEADNTKLGYPVEAYICLDDNSKVESPAALVQGSFLQVCVKIDGTVVTESVLVEDILTFVISQPDGNATDWKTISNTVPDPLTDKVCRESGICNVKSQLQSKFFTDINPVDLRIDGVAILVIKEGNTPAVRRLLAPIRGLLNGDDVKAFMAAQQHQNDDKATAILSVFADLSQRSLQNKAALSEFSLGVGLQGESGDSSSEDYSTSSILLAAFVVAVAVLSTGCCLIGSLFAKRRLWDKKQTPLSQPRPTLEP
jgi:hypothetical protein